MTSFSTEDDVVLAKFVRNHPCIFDVTHYSYKDLAARENVWRELSDDLGKSVDECKRRWKNIKDTYNKRKRVKRQSKWTTTKPSKWALGNILTFLDGPSEGRANFSNENIKIENTLEDPLASDLDEIPMLYVNCQNGQENEAVAHLSPENAISSSSSMPIEKLKLSMQSVKRLKQNASPNDYLNAQTNEKERIVKEDIDGVGEDPIDVFFKTMALTVKQFEPKLKIKAKMEVMQVISKIEMENNLFNEPNCSYCQ